MPARSEEAASLHVDLPTVVGLALLMMPLTTMWHEIGGHAATCAALGGRVTAIGAFYVHCEGLDGAARRAVALAGAGMDAALALIAFTAWRRAKGDLARLILWLLWVDKSFVAAGYLCFSGATGIGDLGPGVGGGIGVLPYPLLWRAGELGVGIALYVWLVRQAIATLTQMLGQGVATRTARRRIAHGYYATAGMTALIVGLFNPVGLFIVIASAAASSFGGLAGFISVGFAVPKGGGARLFTIARHYGIVAAGVVTTLAFAAILGPTIHPFG